MLLFLTTIYVLVAPPCRLACQVNDSQSLPVSGVTTPGEALSKRCVTLVKTSLKPDIWPSELKGGVMLMIVSMSSLSLCSQEMD